MKLKRSLLAALGILAVVAVPALAGLWPNLPILGRAAYCASFATGTGGQVCASTVPAGPASITGNEFVPADTNLSQGRNPQTIAIPVNALNAGPMSYVTLTPVTASNAISPTTNYGGVIIVGSAALSATTFQMPQSPFDGQQYKVSSTQTIATASFNAFPGTATISNAPTAITVSTTGPYGYEFRYRGATNTWYRLQ